MNNLVIIESPFKANTIKGYLTSSYNVVACKGHLRDLPKSSLGIDIENNYQPKYITIRGKGDILTELRREAKKADRVYLATDPDREGEAIAWHLSQSLGLDPSKIKRARFNELSKPAVREAIQKAGEINMDLVDSQQARRLLDRLVGYKISPLLWKKIRSGLSAGRVQSVATRMIVDRENEIRAFKSEEYWTIDAVFTPEKGRSFKARYYGTENGRVSLANGGEAEKVLKSLEGASYFVSKVTASEKQRNPSPPFTTSLLQQEAYRKLGFQSQRTMMIAQELYEGLSLGKSGQHGLITYMRTDSVRVSDEAREAAKEYIIKNYGAEYYPETPRNYKSKSRTQDAHEAIRPVNLSFSPESVKAFLSNDQYKLYKLVWDRFLASQMASAKINGLAVVIEAVPVTGEEHPLFKASGDTIAFNGFLAAYDEAGEENEDSRNVTETKNARLPMLTEKQTVTAKSIDPAQNFTKPPQRYTEGTLVKVLEEKGIGRPSTFATTISLIISRGYVSRKNKMLVPTNLGEVTTELMLNFFEPIMDYKYTAKLENELDDIAEGDKGYISVIDEFYKQLKELLDKAEAETGEEKIKFEEQKLDFKCDKCGGDMILKRSRYGYFAGCSNYPECRNIVATDDQGNPKVKDEPVIIEGEFCPKCGGRMIKKRSRYGEYLACEKHPHECDFTKQYNMDTGIQCPECKKGTIVRKKGARSYFYGCSEYPECNFVMWYKPVADRRCPKCGGILAVKKNETVCIGKDCDFKEQNTESN
ncbi:MAG: type I DNA topoisomerase [Ruminococcaceae bacterium]|nr:type I DNA topoisomerase [Oscillospiraceae bacterium]